ncbi:hypothetical protein DFH08DRAFT_838347 [Mycena albidolilacea]|uniref:Uncharacterized protein n=1 Tax=Mycena albidolilacea TaxID=1033008 RepID=A0AAD7ANP3_9AGAR|nr:hypothetical protein DFH08DRAFT_838347 [Mycena albidolilacea]
MAPLSTATVLFAFIAIGPRFSTTRSRVFSGGHRCAECASGHGYWLEVPFALDTHCRKIAFDCRVSLRSGST